MKDLYALLALLLLPGILRAETYLVTPEQLENGPLPPAVVYDGPDLVLQFKAETDKATAAQIKGRQFDFSQGVKIELEFQDEIVQTNPFPRLIETGPLSLHFVYEPGDNRGDKGLKALLHNPNGEGYTQVIAPVEHRPGVWRKLTFTYVPSTQIAALKLDDDIARAERVPFTFNPTNQTITLGAAKLANSNRGYNGKMRNIRITTPYTEEPGQATITPPAQDINIEVRHFTVAALKGRHLAFPGVARLPDGKLAVVFREGEAHVDPYGRICITYSADGGQTWSAPVSISDSPSDERDPSIQTLPDGRVLVTHGGWNSWMSTDTLAAQYASETAYIRSQGPENFGGSRYLFSEDGGATFSAPIRIPAFSPHGPAIKGEWFYQPTLANENGKRQVYMYRGTLDGKTWEKLSLIGESDGGNPAVRVVYEEPHTAVLADGTMVTAIRVPSDGYMRISFSEDDGKTWTEPVKTPVRGFPHHLLPLKDGRLLVTYGYRYQPRGIRACISHDGGKTWDINNELVIQNNGVSGDLGYPVSMELEDGQVMTVYYHNTRDNPDCYIEAAVYRP